RFPSCTGPRGGWSGTAAPGLSPRLLGLYLAWHITTSQDLCPYDRGHAALLCSESH
uniref:Uncharacterized protein n=1 Tax=Cyclopterus lumpus TaxID=8103 RepID=A0A8C2W9X8_CYCLU